MVVFSCIILPKQRRIQSIKRVCWPSTISTEINCFVANYIYYHFLVNFHDSDWLITSALENPHALTLLTIDSGDRHGPLVVFRNVHIILQNHLNLCQYIILFTYDYILWSPLILSRRLPMSLSVFYFGQLQGCTHYKQYPHVFKY